MDDTFIFHKEWIENVLNFPVEKQDQILGDIVRYGAGMKLEHTDDVTVDFAVKVLKSRIDYSKSKYEQKVQAGKNSGRKKKYDDEQIYTLAREGKKAKEIAKIIGVSESTVNHSQGWQNKNNNEFIF